MDFYVYLILLIMTTEVSSQVNIALKGTAFQSSTFTNGEPSRAIDGKSTDRCLYLQKSVSCTQEEATPWWMVEFQDLYKVSEVIITSRAKSSRRSPWVGYFHVLVGNFSDVNDFVVCARKTRTGLSDGDTISVSCEAVGTHVAIQRVINPRRKRLCLCEVQTIGVRACAGGKYGANCDKTCLGCRKGLCHGLNGKCLQGCNPGYLGENCDTQVSTTLQEGTSTSQDQSHISTNLAFQSTTSPIRKRITQNITVIKMSSPKTRTNIPSVATTIPQRFTTARITGVAHDRETTTSQNVKITNDQGILQEKTSKMITLHATNVNDQTSKSPSLLINATNTSNWTLQDTSTIPIKQTTRYIQSEPTTGNGESDRSISVTKPKEYTTKSRALKVPTGANTLTTLSEGETNMKSTTMTRTSTSRSGGVPSTSEKPLIHVKNGSATKNKKITVHTMFTTEATRRSTGIGEASKRTSTNYLTVASKFVRATFTVPPTPLTSTATIPSTYPTTTSDIPSTSPTTTSDVTSAIFNMKVTTAFAVPDTTTDYQCRPGFYGQLCQYKCSENCANDCDKMTGQCRMCSVGFTGQFCDNICSKGSYGFNCLNACPRSCGRSCHPTDGRCIIVTTTFGPTHSHTVSNKLSTIVTSKSNKLLPKSERLTNQPYPRWPNTASPTTTGVSINELGLQTENSGAPVAAIVIPIILLLALIAGGVLLLVFLLRRVKRNAERNTERNTDKDSTDAEYGLQGPFAETSIVNENSIWKVKDGTVIHVDEDGPLDVERVTEDLTATESFTSTSVLVTELATRVNDLTKEVANKSFQKEFISLPTGPLASIEYGSRPEMYPKNRYKEVTVYDYNRVVLESVDGNPISDYINASYVDSYKIPKQYIVTQGPSEATLYDFVRMLWEQDVPVIIMLTNLIEEGQVKCSPYWPDPEQNSPLHIGEFKIETLREKKRSKYVIRTMLLTKDGNYSEGKEIKHCHFVSWPDRERPSDPSAFLIFKDDVHFLMEKELRRGPTVVHCSAGVGRSGTYLAFDYLMEQAMEEEKVDVVECVKMLRGARVDMVQNLNQYKFIHELLLEAIFCGKTSIPVSNFHTFMQDLKEKKYTNECHQQFDILEALSPSYNENNFQSALLDENKFKNRPFAPLAHDNRRVILRGIGGKATDYINAIKVESASTKTSFIVTQTPLPGTITAFWKMVLQYNCSTIVSLDTCKSEDFQPFWPPVENEELEFDSNKCMLISETDVSSYIQREIKIGNGTSDDLMVKQLELSGWPVEDAVPRNAGYMLDLIETVSSRSQRLPKNNNIVIQCHDGASRSGVFLALLFICKKIDTTQEVDIYHTVHDIKQTRPEFISSLEQYQFLYQFIVDYINEGERSSDVGPSISLAGAY